MLDEIGRILARARTRANMTIERLAREASVPLSAIEAIEAGRPGLTTTDLGRVARALSLNETALLHGGEQVDAEPASVFLRHAPTQDFVEDDLPILDEAAAEAQALLALGDLLGVGAGPRRSGRFEHRTAGGDRPWRAAHEGYDLAREVREALGLGDEPLGDLRPVAEENLDIAIVVRPLHSTRATAVGVRRGGAAAIVLNENDPERAHNPLLARVHVGHEMCHLLFDLSDGGVHVVVDTIADRRDLRAEQRARGFAAELLLPLSGLEQLLGKPSQVSAPGTALDMVNAARRRFGTPHEIAAHHLCNRGLVDERLHDWLVSAPVASLPLGGARTSLPQSGRRSIVLAERVQRAHERGVITDGEARAQLGCDVLMPLPWD